MFALTLLGALVGDVWGVLLLGGLLRLVVNHHVTFFINSLAHYRGAQPYTDANTARDNPRLAMQFKRLEQRLAARRAGTHARIDPDALRARPLQPAAAAGESTRRKSMRSWHGRQ